MEIVNCFIQYKCLVIIRVLIMYGLLMKKAIGISAINVPVDMIMVRIKNKQISWWNQPVQNQD